MDEALDQGESEFDTIMREQPLAFEDDSDDESYEEDNRGRSRIRSKRAQESQRDPIFYVVDRGLDLRPGVERPNLYDGHATSWRNYNADDIGAYNAMATHRARDLAVHLYNAHAIRRRARETARKNPGVVNKAPLRVSKRWAAWPVHATTVPRANEVIEREMDLPNTFQMEPDPRPSAELEDCLTSLILKASKEAFQAREVNFEDIEDNPEYKMNDADELMEDELRKKDEEELVGGEEEEPVDIKILEPTVLLDEEDSLRQLRPVVRNVISHVDRLLYGLHCAMKGRKYDEDSGDEQWTDSDEEDYQTRETRKRGSRSRSRGRTSARQESQEREPSRRSNSARAYYTEPETGDESLRDVSQTRGQSPNSPTADGNHPTKRRLKLRDWSEVMGLAAMMSLPTPAVMRASKRCADLFGEDMEFRILPEGKVRKKRKANDQEEYAYTESESESDSAPPSPQLPPRPANKRKTKTKPGVEPKPKPKSKPKATAKIQSQRRSKSYLSPAIIPPSSSPPPSPPPPPPPAPEAPPEPTEPIAEIAEQVADQEPKTTKKVVGKGPHRKADIICPIKTCSRHTKGFSRKWNLNQHLKNTHAIHVAPGIESSIERDDENIMLE
jgi:hypothetical protein